MKPGSAELEGNSFQEFSSPAVPAAGVDISAAHPGCCQAEHFHALEECTTIVDGPQTDVNSLDYSRCKTETLIEIVKRVGDLITPENLSVLQNLASARRQSSQGEVAEQLLALVSKLQASRIPS